MSKVTGLNFETIENSYDSNLNRVDTGILEPAGTVSLGAAGDSDDYINREITGKDFEDLWISSWIKSRNYKPKTSGFLIDGKKGYIECMKLYVGVGGIEGGSIHIPDEVTADSFHTNSSGDSWWGCSVVDLAADINNADAYILSTGQAKFQNAVLSDNITLSGLQSGSEIAIQGWTHDMTFSATDHDTVEWTSGTIKLLDGTTFSISSGNTGAMTSVVYVYFSKSDSETVLQVSDDCTDAIGSNKILICTAQNVASPKKAIFQPFSGNALGGAGKLMVTDNLAANCVTANLVGANEIITNSANIANAVIGNAHITGTITVGHTDADVTADNAQAYNWLTGSKPPVNADNTAANAQSISWLSDSGNFGNMAWEDLVEYSKLGSTVIVGGYIKTSLLTATNIVTGTLTGIRIRTASSGKRVELYSNELLSYESDGTLRLKIDEESIRLYDGSGGAIGYIYGLNSSYGTYVDGGICTDGDIQPYYSGSSDLGYNYSGFKWRHLYLDQNMYMDDNQYIYWGGDKYIKSDGTHLVLNQHIATSSAASNYNCGTNSNYFNEMHCKSVNDHSMVCYDDGIELLDGRKVSDLEAIQSIKASTKKSEYGMKYLDKQSMPKDIYHPAPIAKKDIYEYEGEEEFEDELEVPADRKKWDKGDKKMKIKKFTNTRPKKVLKYKKGEKVGEDSTNMSLMMSLVIGSLKEIDNRLKILENKTIS